MRLIHRLAAAALAMQLIACTSAFGQSSATLQRSIQVQEQQMAKVLHLNSKQQTQLHTIDEKYTPQFVQYQTDVVKLMRSQKPGQRPDPKALASLRTKVQSTMLQYNKDLNAILTPAQRKQLQQINEQNRQRQMEMMKRYRGMTQQPPSAH